MFIILNRIGNSITGSIAGESFGVSFNQDKWDALKQLQAASEAVETTDELQLIVDQAKSLARETYKEIVEHKTPYLYVNPATGKFYLKVGTGDNSKVSSQPLPEAFVDRIVKSVELGIDVLPLVKAWSRFLRNPNYSYEKAVKFANYINTTYVDYTLVDSLMKDNGVSREVATERATGFQTPITQEGLICTYKVSRELDEKYVKDGDGGVKLVPMYDYDVDPITGETKSQIPQHVEERYFYPAVQGTDGGDAFFCGDLLGHIIRVGQVHRLENWSQVDCNDSRSCVKGLHCGNLDYIKGYQSQGTETHQVFVDPMNIGAFTNDGSGAIRVLEYFVYKSFAGPNRGIYHSSKYAAQTDKAFEASLEEAVAKYAEDEAARQERLAEKHALAVI